MSAYNYFAAGIAFSQGSSFEDISANLGIPIDTLKTEARQHGWKRLAGALSVPTKQLDSLQLDIDAIVKNRRRSMEDTKPLETLLGRTLEIYNRWWDELGTAESDYQVREDELNDAMEACNTTKCPENEERLSIAQKAFASAKEERDALRTLAAPSPKALAELAKAIATIHDIRYRAVGDQVNKGTPDGNPKSQINSVTINMPTFIAKSRGERTFEAQVVPPQELGDGT